MLLLERGCQLRSESTQQTSIKGRCQLASGATTGELVDQTIEPVNVQEAVDGGLATRANLGAD